MKILILGTAFPLRGGIAHFNALLARHLSRQHEVETITFKRQYPSFLFPGTTQDEQGDAMDTPAAPRLIDSINPFNWFVVANEVRRRNPDLLIFKYWMPFFGPCFGTIAKLATRGRKTQTLFICDNIIPHERRPGDIMLTKYAFHQADAFIVQSDAVERELNHYFPGVRYKKVPHPVYENFGVAQSKESARNSLGITAKRVMLFFGYVRKYKGLMVLLETMTSVANDVELLVVGEFYDDEEKYRAKVSELGIGQRVRFVSHYVANDEVAHYFSAADVVVLPYLSATQSGIVQIAYNFDRPVIATDVGGLAEVVIDRTTGFIVPANDAKALGTAISKFYEGNHEQKFSENVKIEKLKYSWDNLVTNIETLVADGQ